MSETAHCTCSSRRDGFMFDEEGSAGRSELWVHAGCGKPTLTFLEGWLATNGFYETPVPAGDDDPDWDRMKLGSGGQ